MARSCACAVVSVIAISSVDWAVGSLLGRKARKLCCDQLSPEHIARQGVAKCYTYVLHGLNDGFDMCVLLQCASMTTGAHLIHSCIVSVTVAGRLVCYTLKSRMSEAQHARDKVWPRLPMFCQLRRLRPPFDMTVIFCGPSRRFGAIIANLQLCHCALLRSETPGNPGCGGEGAVICSYSFSV